MKMEQKSKWGFLRETQRKAEESGLDKDTGLCRTGLEKYLQVIYPEIDSSEWVHNKQVGNGCSKRPDYRCEKLHLIIEFDGVLHYQKPEDIIRDIENQMEYETLEYQIIRIPYFIQLTNEVIEQLFGRKVEEQMFPPSVPSMGIKGKNTPAFCCIEGLKRMASDFRKFPQQYEVNKAALEKVNKEYLTGIKELDKYYKEITSKIVSNQ